MTREVAIEVLKCVDENASCDDCLYYAQMEDCPTDEDCIIRQALEMAIQALSSWEEYSDKLWKEAYERGKTEALSQEPCIYDLKNRYCPRLNEHGMLKYPLQEPTTPMSTFLVEREAVLEAVSEGCQEWRGIYGRCEELINALPSVTQKSGKWIITYPHGEPIYECPCCHASNSSVFKNYCPNCGAKMVEPQESEE